MTDQRLKLRKRALVLALALSSACPAVAANTPAANGWGVAVTDVTPDPAIRLGTLPNGMKFAIMRNATPKGAASVRLNIAFGSIAESEGERGLAHFIEHMAFNGTTHVAEGDMVKILERQGLAFGPDTNAMTGFDNTTYMLDLPKADAEHVDTAMFLLREVASEVKFDPAAVDRERGVILGEKRARDTFQLQQLIDIIGFQLPKTPYPNRLPIGTEAVLKGATADTIKNLYRRYYRPENATLVFVGDADPAAIEAKIRKGFGDWRNGGEQGAPLPRGTIDLNRPTAFDTFSNPAVATAVDYTVTRPWTDPADTRAERRRKVVEAIASGLLNRRLQRLVNAPDSPLLSAGMMTQEQKMAGLMTTVKVIGKDEAWKPALTAAEQEVRRAKQFGFTAPELKTQLAEMEAGYRTAAEQARTRPNQSLAGVILSVIDERDFITTPQYRYDLFKEIAKTLTVDEVNAAFRTLWTGSAPLIHVSSKEAIADSQIASLFTESSKIAVSAPKDVAAQAFAYENFGTPGRVAEDRLIKDLGVREIRFANNVRLNIKKTDFEAGRVRFLVRLGDGQLDLPKDKPGLGTMIAATSGLGALKKHSLEDLKEIAAGRVVSLGASVMDDAFIATGATTQADLGLQMKLSAAYLTDPGFRPEAASQWANMIPIIDKQIFAQPQSVAGYRLPVLLASGDERFGFPAANLLAARSFAEAKTALDPVIASAPIEVTLVGDIDEESAIKAVAATFGALPTRKLRSDIPALARAVTFRADRTPILLRHTGEKDQAMVAAIWPTDDDRDFRKFVGIDLLGDVLNLMLTESVREQLGDSYGVSVSSNMSDTFRGFGYLSASAIVAPDKVDEVQKAIDTAAAELRVKPISADLLSRAKAPALEAVDKAFKDNGYWIASLSQAQSMPERLDRIRQQRKLIESMTAADLQKLAVTYLAPSKLQVATILSDKVPR